MARQNVTATYQQFVELIGSPDRRTLETIDRPSAYGTSGRVPPAKIDGWRWKCGCECWDGMSGAFACDEHVARLPPLR